MMAGKVLTGDTGNSGYFGHASVAFDGPICNCGAFGCVEYYAGGAAMVLRGKESGIATPLSDFATLNSLADSGNIAAIATIESGATAIAQATVNVMLINDLTKIIVTGGVVLSSDIFYEKMVSEIASRIQPHAFLLDFQIRKALLDSSSAELGAALLAREVLLTS
ncbi:MAG: ROK family protein [Actinobacteria bacterium]|nr:ROK family protein [Actinomycetota bacterium]